MALIVVGILLIPRLFKPEEELEKSIAVLPFKNDSPQASEENTPFVNGLMEEILINLQTIKEFRVPGRTSVEQFRDNTSKKIPEIARELDVNYIVEGSVQKYGDRFRLRVQLIRAKGKEAHLWAKSYEQAITGTDDIFKIQSEIAQAIATELKIVISPDEKQLIEQSPTENLDAYYAFLRGKDEYSNYFLLRKNIDALNRAEDFYNRALEYDPSYAKAYSGLAQVYWEKYYAKEYFYINFMDSVLVLANIALEYDNNLAEAYSLRGDYYRVNTIYDKAIEEYKKTLDINPNYWQAYDGMGELHFYHLRDLENGLINLEKALKLNHDLKLRPGLLYSLSACYEHIGFYDKSVDLKKEALRIDRDSLRFYSSMRWAEVLNENYLKAIQLLERCIILNSKQSSGYYRRLGDYYLLLGHRDTAIKCYQKYIAGLSELEEAGLITRHRVGFAYLATGDSVMAEKYFELQKKYCEESIELNREYARNATAYYDLACIYAYRGDKKNAYKNLHIYNDKIGETEIKSMLWWFKHDPFFNSIRDEPEFQAIYREIEAKYNNTYERVRKRLEEKNML